MSDAPSPSLHQFDALRQANLARAKEWNPTGADTGPGFAGLELAGEVGELCNLLKKAERARLGLVGGSVSPAAIAEELADVVICADLVGLALGLDLWPIVVAKFNATSEAKGFATRLGDPIPVSVARFKDAGHPATAAGEALDSSEDEVLQRCRQHMRIRDDLALIEELRRLLLTRLDRLGEPGVCGWIKQLVIQSFEGQADHSRLLANAGIVGMLFALARPADGAGGVS